MQIALCFVSKITNLEADDGFPCQIERNEAFTLFAHSQDDLTAAPGDFVLQAEILYRIKHL